MECVHVVNECVHDMNECVHVVNEHVHVVNECVHVVAHKVTMKVTKKETEKVTMKNASGGAGVASLPCQINSFSSIEECPSFSYLEELSSGYAATQPLLSLWKSGFEPSLIKGNEGRVRSCGEHTPSGGEPNG